MKNFYLLFLLSFFSFQNLNAQGETCQTATPISPGLNTSDGPSSGNGCHNCSPGDIGGIPAENADWFTFTPAESGVIDLSTCGMGVDTRVWIYTGNCADLIQIAGSDDVCDFAPGEPFAAKIENLTVEAGTTYYIEFDDAWETGGFNFELNFKKVSNNVFIRGYDFSFSQIPENQLRSGGIPLTFTVGKQGPAPQSGLVVVTEVYDADTAGAALQTYISATFDLPEQPITITSGALENLPVGEYFLIQTVIPPGNDEIAIDNVAISRTFQVTERTFAVDDNDFIGNLGIPGPGKIRQGQSFNFQKTDEIHSVSVNVVGGNLGDTVWVEVYEVDPSTGSPTILAADSKKVTLQSGDPEWIEIPLKMPFNTGDPNATYFFSLTHLATGSSVDLGVSEEIFKPRTAWISVEEDPWVPLESIGTGDFLFAYAIRPNNQSETKQLMLKVDMRDETASSEGVYLNYSTENQAERQTLMINTGGGIWETELSVSLFSNVKYRFSNGTTDFEEVPLDCGVLKNGVRFRSIDLRLSDESPAPVCFGRCGICPIQGCPDPAYIICDDFEQYDLGNLSPQALFWRPWDSNAADGLVSDENPAGGTKSLLIDGASPGETQDLLLLLNDVTSGAYELKWNQFVPSGSAAFWGIMHRNPPDEVAGHAFFFDPGGSGEIWNGNDPVAGFVYPENEWFEVLLKIYFRNDFASLSVNGSEVAFFRFSDASDLDGNPLPSMSRLAGINFFPLDASYRWFVDDVFYREINDMPEANLCMGAIDLNHLLSNGDQFIDNNAGYTSEFSDPHFGYDCFGEPDGSAASPELNHSKWYTFTGDGNKYRIHVNRFDDTLHVIPAQLALYSGDCLNLSSVGCSDGGFASPESITLQTMDGVDYFFMVDTDNSNTGSGGGDYRIEIHRVIDASFRVNMKNFLLDGNSIDTRGINLHFNYAGYSPLSPFTENGDSTYSIQTVIPSNGTFDYHFLNGHISEPKDSLINCGRQPLFGRSVTTDSSNIDLPLVCWGLCRDCPDVTSDVADNLMDGKIRFFPNPVDRILTIESDRLDFGPFEINIVNQLGQPVFHEKTTADLLTQKIDVSNWKSGLYLFSMSLGGKPIHFEKIIIY